MSAQGGHHRGVRIAAQLALVAVVIAAGAGVAALLTRLSAEPERTAQEAAGPLVEVHVGRRGDTPVVVAGHGTVEPRVQIDLVPQVSGKVRHVDPALIDGGEFDANDTLVRIEKIDYELAVHQAEARVASAEAAVAEAESALQSARTELQIQQAEAEVARAEWKQNHPNQPVPPLVGRQPQVQRARAAVESARAGLESARGEVTSAKAQLRDAQLQLQRTELSVPFAGRVLRENVDVGQHVTTGQSLATVYGTDRLQVHVPLEDRHLQWFDLARPADGNSPGDVAYPGAAATLRADFAGRMRRWAGRAVRTAGRIDPESRLVDVVVEVDETKSIETGRRLMPGMFVDVAIEGRMLRDVVAVPRHALRGRETVWVATELSEAAADPNASDERLHGRLVMRRVTVARSDRDFAYISDGLEDGDAVITSLLDVVTDGMKIRVSAEELPGSSSSTRSAGLSGAATQE